MFVFLSGYLTKENLNGKTYKDFCIKRIRKVLVPYLVWSVFYSIAHGRYKTLLIDLLTTSSNGIFYYIFVYVQLVLITPVVFRLLNSKWSGLGWLVTPVSLLFTEYIPSFIGITPELPWFGICFTQWFSYYYLGIAFGNHKILPSISIKAGGVMYLIALLVSEMEGLLWYHFENDFMAVTQARFSSLLLSSVCCLLSVLYLTSQRTSFNRLEQMLAFVGDCSFGIYLSHLAVLSVLNHIPKYEIMPFPVNSILLIALTCLCIIVGNKILSNKISQIIGISYGK